MATIIKIEDIHNGMESFLTYFNENLLDQNNITKEKLDTAFRILYNKQRTGGSCASCLVNVYNMLKNVYDTNYKPISVETIVIESPNKVEDSPIEVVETIKKKGRK